MSNAEPVHFTHLKQIARSPAHYLAATRAPSDKPSLRFGRLVHFLVLGGNYAVYEGKRLGNAWKDFEAAHQDVEIFTASEVADAAPVARAVMADPLVRSLGLLEGEHEREVRWEYMGRVCSSRLDVLDRGRRRIVDLKTASTTEPDRFAFASRRYGYHAQAAFYADAAAFIDAPVDEAFLISVETEDPYAVTVFHFSPRLLEVGRKQVRLWFERLLQCEAANDFPAYTQSVVELDVPDEDGFALNWGDEEAAQ